MAGRLEDLEPDLSERHRLAVGERREVVLGLGTGAEIDPGALAVAQLEVPGDEIRVKVGQEDMRDPAPEPVRASMYSSTSRCGSITAASPLSSSATR